MDLAYSDPGRNLDLDLGSAVPDTLGVLTASREHFFSSRALEAFAISGDELDRGAALSIQSSQLIYASQSMFLKSMQTYATREDAVWVCETCC